MRFYLGHKLPLGFFAGIGVGSYSKARVQHPDGSTIRPSPSFFTIGFVVGVAFVLLWLFTR